MYGNIESYSRSNFIFLLIPKGLGLLYVGFSDSGQAVVNEFYF